MIGGLIVFKLELEPPMSESSPRKVVRDALYKLSFLGFRYEKENVADFHFW